MVSMGEGSMKLKWSVIAWSPARFLCWESQEEIQIGHVHAIYIVQRLR